MNTQKEMPAPLHSECNHGHPRTEHTPTPWFNELSTVYASHSYQSESDEPPIVCSTINRADAAFIVRAVNAHEELLTALRSAHRALEYLADPDEEGLKCTGHSRMAQCIQDDMMQAIGKAEGK